MYVWLELVIDLGSNLLLLIIKLCTLIGSGKTAVFLIPLIQKLKSHKVDCGVRGLLLAPSRELASQTFRFCVDMAKFTDLRAISIVGGDGIEAQFDLLAQHPDIIVATPGRLMHHLREISTFRLQHVQYLVFDEADRLFEMGVCNCIVCVGILSLC